MKQWAKKRAHPEARHDKGERPDRRGAVLRVHGAARAIGGGRKFFKIEEKFFNTFE
jgi:hypothetical protein